MAFGTLAQSRNNSPLARVAADRRRHKRFAVSLIGRFMRTTKHEYPCKLIDISVGGASVTSPVRVTVGEKIIAYFDHIGGIEGHVVRITDDGFAMRLNATLHKREKLAAQITWLVNRHELDPADERRHERTQLINKLSTLHTGDGYAIPCYVLDISASGASIGTDLRPEPGAEIIIGKLRARVMRHHEQGIGVQFLDLQDPDALRRYFE